MPHLLIVETNAVALRYMGYPLIVETIQRPSMREHTFGELIRKAYNFLTTNHLCKGVYTMSSSKLETTARLLNNIATKQNLIAQECFEVGQLEKARLMTRLAIKNKIRALELKKGL